MRLGIVKRSGTHHLPRLAQRVEAAGFDTLMVTEHSHVPAGSMSADEARRRANLLDPFVALGAAAALTSRLRLGTAVCVVTHREPFGLAKAVATLDLLSGGRFVFGVGTSSVVAENRSYGIGPGQRLPLLRERVAALKRLWTGELAEYHGELVDFGPSWSGPAPVQRPHPPILVGGGPARLGDVLDWADGWLPHPPDGFDLAATVARLRADAAAAGRPRPLVTIFNAPADPATLATYAEAGVDSCLLDLRAGEPDEARAELADLRRRIDPVWTD
jgi:probable F420-dependent oxidoreductase